MKKDDLRLDSKNDSRDLLDINYHKNDISFFEIEKLNSQIFSENVKNYIKSRDNNVVNNKIDKLLKYCFPHKDSNSKLFENSNIIQETSLNLEQDSFHNEFDNFIKTKEKDVTESSILERNKQKFLNLKPVFRK